MGRSGIVKYLVEQGADVNSTNDDITALMLAAGNGHLKISKCLFLKKVNFLVLKYTSVK